MKNLLRYIKGTTAYGLFFKRDGTTEITGYSDNSHNIDVNDGISTTGFMFYLGTSPITWTSCKQPRVALSSCEAEFMAATEASKQEIWLKELMVEIMNKEDKKVVLKIDNKSGIALTKNPVFHGRSKYILLKYHLIRECVEFDFIEVKHVPYSLNHWQGSSSKQCASSSEFRRSTYLRFMLELRGRMLDNFS